MSKVMDARGLSCPQPVVLTNKALEEADEVTVIVDNPISRDNVSRMVERHGCEVNIEEKEDGIYLHLTRGATAVVAPAATSPVGPTVLVMASEQMGRGEKELGNILIRALLHTLTEVSPLPDKMIFFNTGVNLTVEGSEVLEDLRTLQKEGVEILVCGTCLGYFDLKEKVAVGQISNMYTIAETMLSAGRLITV